MNKETLQNNNNRLAKNNLDLASVLETINNLPEAGLGELSLQDKTIEITENGTTNVTADEGYDGLNNVEVITNVKGGGVEDEGKPAPMTMSFKNYKGTELKGMNNIDVSNITTMEEMFYGCTSLVELDLSGWDTSNVTIMGQMFSSCSALETLDIRNFVFSKVSNGSGIFNDVPTSCLIIVKDDTAKEWVLSARSDLTNVKTVAEL